MEWHACVVCWKKSICRIRKPSPAYVHIQYLQPTLWYSAESCQQHGKHSECRLQPQKDFSLLEAYPDTFRDPEKSLNFFIAMGSNIAVLINLSGTLPSHKLYLLHRRNETSQFSCCRTRDSSPLRGFFSIPLPIALSLWAFGYVIFLLLPPVARETESHRLAGTPKIIYFCFK